MASNVVTRTLNKELINAIAYKRAKIKFLNTDTQIDMYGTTDDGIFKMITSQKGVPDSQTEQQFTLDELDITEEELYGYYQYRINPRNIKRYDAIRIERPKQYKDDPNWWAYNAVVIQANVKMFSFIMNPSRGPIFRYLTARSIYTNGINVYRYSEINNTIENEGYNFIIPGNFICSELEPVPMTNEIVWGKIEDPCENPECKDYIWVSNMLISSDAPKPGEMETGDIWGFVSEECE